MVSENIWRRNVGCGGGREEGGGERERERGQSLGNQFYAALAYQLIFPPMWRLARTDQLCRAAVFCKNSSFVGFMALYCCRDGEYWSSNTRQPNGL